MALASSVLMFAASPQTFLGVASAQESLLLLIDVLPAYGRHFRGELEQTLAKVSSFIAKPFARREPIVCLHTVRSNGFPPHKWQRLVRRHCQ
jgi:hypothetical protein